MTSTMTVRVPVDAITALTDAGLRTRLLRAAANRPVARWDEAPWVAHILAEAREASRVNRLAGHKPGYWAAPCAECDRTPPTVMRACGTCHRYGRWAS